MGFYGSTQSDRMIRAPEQKARDRAEYSKLWVSLLVRETMRRGYFRIPPIARRQERPVTPPSERISTCRAPSPLLREQSDDDEVSEEYAAMSIEELRAKVEKLRNKVKPPKRQKRPKPDAETAEQRDGIATNAPRTPCVRLRKARRRNLRMQQKKHTE
ncbi:hypothetical protein CAPTEDRAFT_210045 [Capitella teleta]|uniref:Uncharacterized protein n=1 Tax=Capitella teleta TaxID=283909 RepID=R7TZ48_CAPTE|nr:hypothetical protein CAPTEDRAFT_210045 [Capitella teleta]|eukprot:ELT96686.1 hypothetical protein CAPTEDRAFT_210045 [Capitella teleta]